MGFNSVKRPFETARAHELDSPMTKGGTLVKLSLLLGAMLCSAAVSWLYIGVVGPLLFVGAIAGLIIGFVTIFKPHLAPYTAIPYAICQGMALGAISMLAELKAPGIVQLATVLTTATAVGMLLLYRLEIIRVTETVK